MARARVSRHQLHLVTEPRGGRDGLLPVVAAALQGGIDWVQLRDKSGSAGSLYAEGLRLREAAESSGGCLSINDRLDVALALGAHGIHLSGQSLPVAAAVRVATARLLVGRSVHTVDEAIGAARDGADYLTFGHIFPTTSHPGMPPRGLAELRAIVLAVDIPVLAIGGITATTLDEVLATGCAGIAVISAILSHADPGEAAARLRAALDQSPYSPRHPFRPTPQSAKSSVNTTAGHPHEAHPQPTAV